MSTKLFSHDGQKVQELLCVALFLDLSGVNFDAAQLRPERDAPPDVIFHASQGQQCCNFEVGRRLDPGIKLHGPYREAVEEIRRYSREGKTFEDYVDNASSTLMKRKSIVLQLMQPKPISLRDLLLIIEKAAVKKHKKYTNGGKAERIKDLDLLIVVQSKEFYLLTEQKELTYDSEIFQEFRSVSFWTPTFWSGIITLKDHAPAVLHDIHKKGLIYNDRPQIYEEWDETLRYWLADVDKRRNVDKR